MATTLTVTGNSRCTYSFSDGPAIGSLAESVEIRTTRSVENGTGAGQANVAWRNRVTISAGQSYSMDLLDLGATAFGFAGKVVVNTLKEFFVVVNTTTASRYVLVGVIGPSDTTGYSARVNRGGDYRVADYQDGWAVTNGVNNVLYIANPSAGSVEIDVLVVGVGSTADT
jgi:hypothetical protein